MVVVMGHRGPICMKQQVAEISLTNHRLSWLYLWEAPRYHLSPPRPVPTSSSQQSWDIADRALAGELCVLYCTGRERMGLSPLCVSY